LLDVLRTKRNPAPQAKRGGIRFATFAPLAVRNSGYISHDLDGREKYLRKFLYFSFFEWSRIRFAFAAKAVWELAHKRLGVRIFAKGEIPGMWRTSIALRQKVCYNEIT
jgi:hypothetical protein